MPNWVRDYVAEHPELAALPVYKRAERSLHLRLPDGQIGDNYLLSVSPCASVQYIGNSALMNVESLPQFLLCNISHCIQRPQFEHLSGRNTVPLPGFRSHISHIVRVSTKKQMGGVYTVSHITVVANKQPIRNRAISQFPRVSMGRYALIVDRYTAITSKRRACPQPAPIGSFLCVLPETLYYSCSPGKSPALMRAIPGQPLFEFMAVSDKCLSALSADRPRIPLATPNALCSPSFAPTCMTTILRQRDSGPPRENLTALFTGPGDASSNHVSPRCCYLPICNGNHTTEVA